ncbi:MAG: hypothetical protein ACRDT6_27495 [Micromonosporaceae bacterium]
MRRSRGWLSLIALTAPRPGWSSEWTLYGRGAPRDYVDVDGGSPPAAFELYGMSATDAAALITRVIGYADQVRRSRTARRQQP